MAFLGKKECDEMNAEEAQIQVTGGGEGEGEGEGYIESEASRPNRALNVTAQSVVVCRQKKTTEEKTIYDYIDLDDWYIRYVIWFHEETNTSKPFWRWFWHCIYGGIYKTIGYDEIGEWTKLFGAVHPFAVVNKGKQWMGFSDENEGCYGDLRKNLYLEIDSSRTRFISLQVNSILFRDAMKKELKHQEKIFEDCLGYSKQVHANWVKENPKIKIFNADPKILAQARARWLLEAPEEEEDFKKNEQDAKPELKNDQVAEEKDLKDEEPTKQLQEINKQLHEIAQQRQQLKLKEKILRQKKIAIKVKLNQVELKLKDNKRNHKNKQQKQGKGKKSGGKGNFAKHKKGKK